MGCAQPTCDEFKILDDGGEHLPTGATYRSYPGIPLHQVVDPTLDDFEDRLDDSIEQSLSAARLAVRDVKDNAILRGALGGSRAILAEFEAVHKQFAIGVDNVLSQLDRAIGKSKFDRSKVWAIAQEKLEKYREQMKDIVRPNVASDALGGQRRSIAKRELPKLDKLLGFQLRQFDVDQWIPQEKPMSIINVHGNNNVVGDNNVIGDGNTAQQGTVNSQMQVTADDINKAVGKLESALATIQLTGKQLAAIKREIHTIKAQTSKTAIDYSIVTSAVQSILNTAKSVCADVLSSSFGQAVLVLAKMFGIAP